MEGRQSPYLDVFPEAIEFWHGIPYTCNKQTNMNKVVETIVGSRLFDIRNECIYYQEEFSLWLDRTIIISPYRTA